MPSARHASVPEHLRERLERRLRTATRLAKWRILLYVLIYSAIMSAAVTVLGEAATHVFDASWLETLATVVYLLLQLISPLSVLALIALVPLNRTLVLLGADIQVLGMEVVARNVDAGGTMPSMQARPDDGVKA